MRTRWVAALTGLAAALAPSVCGAVYGVADRGLWPDSWPEELERVRQQARTLDHGQFVVYEIPFNTPEEFALIWPHILALKSKQAPLTLLAGPNKWLGESVKAGVRLRCPETGELVTFEDKTYRVYPADAESSVGDKKFLKIGPPWPDDIKSESGALPEYVGIDGGKWRGYDAKDLRGSRFRPVWRARLDVELIVDGDIVDLNRIPLPADTPIVDKRFPAEPRPAAAASADSGAEAKPSARQAPPFEAAYWLNSEPLTLEQLRGKTVVLEFWATWCPPCRKTIPQRTRLFEAYKDKGVVFVSLTNETKETVEPFVRKMEAPYPIGGGSPSGKAYNVQGMPQVYLIDPSGRIVWEGSPLDGLEAALKQQLAITPPK
jgi:thiol-disulfide isomerase/thioredoxin